MDEPGRIRSVTALPVFRDAMGVAIATGAYAISFGAIAAAGGLNLWQAMALSLLMFSGASQFGLVAVIAGGGSPWSGVATAVLLGARNAFYGLRLSRVLGVSGWRRLLTAHVVLDESSAMSLGRATPREERIGFYATGIGVFVLWNLGTLIGSLGAAALTDPRVLGLDAAAPAALLALLAPRLRDRALWAVALAAAALAVLTTPLLPPGIPVLLAGAFGILVGALPRRKATGTTETTETTETTR